MFWIGGRPDLPGPDSTLPLDKLGHFAMYAVLGGLAGIGWLRARRWPGVAWPLLFALAFGAADELRQRTIATRSADPLDWVMDAIGALAGFWVAVRRNRG